ncbi:MAG: RelA/SpoT family protein [Mycoplasmatales bacterium]
MIKFNDQKIVIENSYLQNYQLSINDAYQLIIEMSQENQEINLENEQKRIFELIHVLETMSVEPSVVIAAMIYGVFPIDEQIQERIKNQFGTDVIMLIAGLKNIDNLPEISAEDFLEATHRQMFIAMAKDIRVILIKLAMRIYLLKSLKHSEDDQKYKQGIANETLKLYTPIAHRLGLGNIKSELEDLALYYTNPEYYFKIAKRLELKKTERDQLIEEMLGILESKFKKINLKAKLLGRSKHIYSIYNKMYYKNKSFDEIYDLQALRVICETKVDCYTVLGIIHDTFTPINNRFKDYIAVPKPNMYQSLHTSVVGPSGTIFEVQIRTQEMDEVSELGIAAHWVYKEGEIKTSKDTLEGQLHFFRDLLTGEKEDNDYVETIKEEVFESNIFVLSPLGKVVHLPKQASVIDFAYRIHSNVAEKMIGAIVNGTMVPYSTTLKTGDVVEIKTKKSAPGPNDSWLDLAKTTHARQKIRTFIKKKELESVKEYVAKGREMILDEIKERNLPSKLLDDSKKNKQLMKEYNVNNVQALMIEVYMRKIPVKTIVDYLVKKPEQVDTPLKMVENVKQSNEAIIIVGAENISKKAANCCMPVLGDEIVGVVSSGFAIRIHRINCPNVKAIEPIKQLEAYWNRELKKNIKYDAEITIYSNDRNFLLGDITTTFSKLNIGITNIRSRTKKNNVISKVSILVEDTEQLNNAITNLMKIKNVLEVKRTFK